MGNKVIEYVIGAKDATGKAISSALARIKSFASGVGSNLMNIKAGLDMLQGAVSKAMSFMSKAFSFETQTRQFKTLIGSIDEAKAHMADLKALGDTPPFSLDEFAKASRSLMVMTDGALGYKKSLEMIGDAAAATGRTVEEMGQAVGMLYAFIRDGQPLSRAVMQLRNMGVITPEVAQKLQDLQAAGKSNAEIWAEVEAQLGRFKGAMAETEKTGEGLMGAIESRWDNIVRAFGMAWADEAKGGMQTVLDKMKEIEEDGTLAVWAAKVGESIHEAAEAVKALRDELNRVGDAEPIDMFDRSRSGGKNMDHSIGQFFGNAWAQLGATGAYIRGLFVPGENAFNNYLSYGALHGYGGWSDAAARKLNERMRASGEWTEDTDIRSVNEQHYAEIKDEAEKKITEKRLEDERTAAEREVADKKRRDESLAAGQKKTDERNAKAAAEKRAEEEKKAAEKAAAERARLDAQEAASRERERQKEEAERLILEERIHAKRVQLMQDELAQRHREEQDAQQRLAAAISQESRAWGWYRDRDSWKAQLKEERDEAAAQKQFDKDFAKLKDRHRDWRTAKLGDDDELIKRVALAREEKANAQEYARMTAESTQRAADALAAIQAEMEGV